MRVPPRRIAAVFAVTVGMIAAACGSEPRDAVLVTVDNVPIEAVALEATFRLDGAPAMRPERWDAPSGGFPASTTFVVLLDRGTTGVLEVTVQAENAAGCAFAAGSSTVTLPAETATVALSPMPPICDPPDGGVGPDPPQLIAPPNGDPTGSPYAQGLTQGHPLRPRFRWEPVAGTYSYELQIDDSCAAPYADCPFPSPELIDDTTGLEITPSSPLPVSLTPPVGTRYFWRVRSCTQTTCGGWSPVRWVDVGRQQADFNGDGFADVLVGSFGWDEVGPLPDVGAAYLHVGFDKGPSVIADGSWVGIAPGGILGVSVTALGDVNGDHYPDAALGLHNAPSLGGVPGAGQVWVLYGGSSGLTQGETLESDTPVALGAFGHRLAGGDLDGDGYADLIVGAFASESTIEEDDEGRVWVFPGGFDGFSTPSAILDNPLPDQAGGWFGIAIDASGDLDGDGHVDLVIGAQKNDPPPNADEGAAYVYFGGAPGGSVSPVPDMIVEFEAHQAGAGFGSAIATADFDGDGFADLAVGADAYDASIVDDGAVFIYAGGREGPIGAPAGTLTSPNPVGGSHFGDDLGIARDMNRDGYADLLVGATAYTGIVAGDGAVFVYRGGPAGLDTSMRWTLHNPAEQADGLMGWTPASPGDVDGDGDSDLLIGAIGYDSAVTIDSGAVWFYPGDDTGLFAAFPTGSLLAPVDQTTAYFGSSVAW